jgi:pimeloyl-ACP methyl ester carboxylesterase
MNRRSTLAMLLTASAGAGAPRPSPAAVSPRRRATAPFVQARDGTRLYWRSWGEGPPILFVAAWALPSDAWQYQLARLSEAGRRCIAFDRRGHGRSDDPGAGFDMDTLASDVAEVIEQLDLHDLMLVGHSLGAAECVRYLTNHGAARVRRLALIAPTTPCLGKSADNPDGLDPQLFQQMRAAFLSDFPGIVGANIRPFVDASTSERMIDWIMTMMSSTSLKAVLECNRAFTTADFRAELPRIATRTLIIQGDADRSAPISLTGKKTAALLPNCRLETYPGAPHGLIFTHMDRVSDDLLAFARG